MLASCFGWAGNFRGGFGGPDMFGGYGGMWMIGFGILRLLILALVIFLIFKYLVPKFRSNATRENDYHDAVKNSASNALQILNERFVKGEIDAETYQTMKEHLLK
jgi:uncharacterized membrane protein